MPTGPAIASKIVSGIGIDRRLLLRVMIEVARDDSGSEVCRRSALPLLAICPGGHRSLVPLRLIKASADDRVPLCGRQFRCRQCGSRDVTLFVIENRAELEQLRPELLPALPTVAPTNRS